MKTRSYYLLKPNDILLAKLECAHGIAREVLGKPLLWSALEGGKSLTKPDDYKSLAKISFLVSLITEYFGRDDFCEMFEEDVSEELFDKYWSIEWIELAGGVEEISGLDLLAAGVSTSGNEFVSDWIKKLLSTVDSSLDSRDNKSGIG